MTNLAETPTQSADSRVAPAVQPPIDLKNWIEENRHLFKPPVSNPYLYDGRDELAFFCAAPLHQTFASYESLDARLRCLTRRNHLFCSR